MDNLRCFLLDELKTYSPAYVEKKEREYAALPVNVKVYHYLPLMYVKVHSKSLDHVNEAIEELTPELGADGSPTDKKNYIYYLLSVGHYRCGDVEHCLDLLNMRNLDIPPHDQTRAFLSFLDRQLHSSFTKRAAIVMLKGTVLVAGLYGAVKTAANLTPPVAKGIKSIVVNNMELECKDGKIGLSLKFPGKGV